MRYVEIRKLIFREPFKPVRLTVDIGESIVVRHPEDVMVNAYCVIVYHKSIYFQTEG